MQDDYNLFNRGFCTEEIKIEAEVPNNIYITSLLHFHECDDLRDKWFSALPEFQHMSSLADVK